MKISEARKIVSDLISWEMFHLGVNEERTCDINYTLEDMIKANKIVSKLNKRDTSKMVIGKTYHRKIQLTLSNRLIAAMYVAMQHDAKGVSIACCNNKYTGVFK